MLDSANALADGLTIRPARPSDEPFLAALYRSARPDLQLIDADPELIESVVAQQYQTLQTGAGTAYPNAMHYVIEKTAANIGALVVDFGPNEVRVIYLAFIPSARGLGFGRTVLQGVQQAARQVHCPVAAVVWRSNPRARQHYIALGFQVEEAGDTAERLVWYPTAS
ncbi:GNAT family N-acetyltransferase [Chitiniphilus eburneus]|uniref:GNAT family N-acetyltransferase n=1 Tax=Chitiniphilus eburneus TaxID=2571148 RepID=A0A4U0QER4_9NEIS|nr:GNAT family N-acetyltransferase [Chitiniphilus eburneus]TJZ79162.1 GNAT family N-acetyltransferase [Chitiniphilus eburneus]